MPWKRRPEYVMSLASREAVRRTCILRFGCSRVFWWDSWYIDLREPVGKRAQLACQTGLIKKIEEL